MPKSIPITQYKEYIFRALDYYNKHLQRDNSRERQWEYILLFSLLTILPCIITIYYLLTEKSIYSIEKQKI